MFKLLESGLMRDHKIDEKFSGGQLVKVIWTDKKRYSAVGTHIIQSSVFHATAVGFFRTSCGRSGVNINTITDDGIIIAAKMQTK